MGVTGAAVATVTGQMTACGLAVFCFLRTRTGIRITRKDMKIDAGIAKRIYAVGVPSGLMTAMPSLLGEYPERTAGGSPRIGRGSIWIVLQAANLCVYARQWSDSGYEAHCEL